MVSGGKTTSSLETKAVPGAYGGGYAESARLAKQLETMLGKKITSPFAMPYQQAILGAPRTATTPAETALLTQLGNLTSGAASLRGDQPATQTQLASVLAPQLIGERQQNIGNLSAANVANLTQQTAQRGIDTKALNELIGLAMPQTVAGTRGTGKGAQYGGEGTQYISKGGKTTTTGGGSGGRQTLT